MANQKLTKKDYYNMLLNLDAVKESEELTSFIEHELELLESKSANRKPTKTQTENDQLRKNILDAMEENRMYTISQIIECTPSLKNHETMTPQRVSALVTQLKNDNLIIRTEIKRKAYFQLA